MLNDIVLNSIIVTIETLSYRKSIADKLISRSHGYKREKVTVQYVCEVFISSLFIFIQLGVECEL
ncbi:MAG: hypothetical protein RXR51_08370 [Nitrososphaeria archaeon]